MVILHIGLVSSFTEGMSYQDNMLTAINAADGHDVTFISDCNRFVDGKLTETEEEDIITEDGIRLIRLKYDLIINKFISSKFRKIKKLYSIIESIRPDVILFHGAAAFEIINVAKYAKRNPSVKLYVDNHADINNSGTSWLSLNILHKLFYRLCNKIALKNIDKIFYLSEESKEFLLNIYRIPKDKLEFYPIGGIIFSDQERLKKRKEKRLELKLSNEDILLVHSGKMDKFKRTEDIIKAFSKINSKNLKLVIIGSFTDDVKEIVEPLINENENIFYLGWKDSKELSKYLCASDLYIQPGGQSATMQNAICCGSPIAIFPHKSYKFFLNGNGYFIETIDDMIKVFNDIILYPEKIKIMSDNSIKFAHEILDYKKLASRLYM